MTRKRKVCKTVTTVSSLGVDRAEPLTDMKELGEEGETVIWTP